MPWKTKDVVLGIVLILFGVFVSAFTYGLGTGLLVDDGPGSGADLIVVGLASGNIMLMVSWAMGPGQYRISFKSLGLRLPWQRRLLDLFLPVVVVIGSLLFLGIYTAIVSQLGWDILDSEGLPDDIALGGPSILFSFIIIALWGPLGEEVLFRGFIFPGLSGNMGVVRAAMVTSLLFAVLHFSIGLIVPFFVTGMLLTWLYYETGSIWTSFAAHAMQNALALSVSAWG